MKALPFHQGYRIHQIVLLLIFLIAQKLLAVKVAVNMVESLLLI